MHLVHTMNFLELQETIYLLFLIMFGKSGLHFIFSQVLWAEMLKTTKKNKQRVSTSSSNSVFTGDLDTLNRVNYEVRPDCSRFHSYFKSTAAKTTLGNMFNCLIFLWGKK